MNLALHFVLNGFGIATPRPFSTTSIIQQGGQTTHSAAAILAQLLRDAGVATLSGPWPVAVSLLQNQDNAIGLYNSSAGVRFAQVIVLPSVLTRVRGVDRQTGLVKAQEIEGVYAAVNNASVVIGTANYQVKRVYKVNPIVGSGPDAFGRWTYSFSVQVSVAQYILS